MVVGVRMGGVEVGRGGGVVGGPMAALLLGRAHHHSIQPEN